jgi:hypothetical protein
MRFAYLTTDEVNLDLALRVAEECNLAFDAVSFQEPLSDGRFDAVIYDWDYLPPDKRRELLAQLLSGPLAQPLALHSYNLSQEEVDALRGQGAIVSRHLASAVLRELRRAVNQAHNNLLVLSRLLASSQVVGAGHEHAVLDFLAAPAESDAEDSDHLAS